MIQIEDFDKVELRVGTIVQVHFAPPNGHRCVCQRPLGVASGRG